MDDRDSGPWTHSEKARLFLLVSVVLTLFVPRFMLLSTLAHELGHGIAGLLTGGTFERFHVFADGSGLAETAPGTRFFGGALASALVSMGGLVGPAVTAAIFFVAARRPLAARVFLIATGIGLLVTTALLVRETFGIAFIVSVAVVLLATGVRAPAWGGQLLLAFVAVQLSLSVWSRSDYLFVREAHVDGQTLPSDVENVARALGGPYWLWGIFCGGASVVALLGGGFAFIRASAREERVSSPVDGRRGVT